VRSIALSLASVAVLSFGALAGCSGAGGNMSIPGGGSAGAGGSGSSRTAGAKVDVRIVAVQTPVANTDGSSRETPLDQRMGILGLELLRSETDASPLVVFHSNDPVDTGYNDGDDTLVGTATAADLTSGTYLFARVPVAWVKFTVDGTYHTGAYAVPGQFADTISLSQETMLDGAQRDQGWFSDTFLVSGVAEGTTSGEGAAFGQPAVASGIHLDMSAPMGAYVFPVHVVIDPAVDHDVTLKFTLNTYEDFHWQDESTTGYATGVFDVSYGTWEPVTQLGANSVVVTLE
jgi:hypothetical protein